MEKDNIPREKFTNFEIARILGARALQIAMDAPYLTNITKKTLEKTGDLAEAILELSS